MRTWCGRCRCHSSRASELHPRLRLRDLPRIVGKIILVVAPLCVIWLLAHGALDTRIERVGRRLLLERGEALREPPVRQIRSCHKFTMHGGDSRLEAMLQMGETPIDVRLDLGRWIGWRWAHGLIIDVDDA